MARRKDVAGEVIIELAQYHRHATTCVGVIFASNKQQQLQPVNADAPIFQRHHHPLLQDVLLIGVPRAISRGQEDRVEMFLGLSGQRRQESSIARLPQALHVGEPDRDDIGEIKR
jgi:hypothetical protein